MMSHHEVDPEALDGQAIERVAAELRTPVPVRAEWRAGLLRGIAMQPPPKPAAETFQVVRHWRLRPVTAIAAGLACALVGAGATALLLGDPLQRGSADRSGSLTASMPLPGETNTDAGGRSSVRFVFVAPHASRVALVGDFNGWNPSAMPMRRSTDGHAWMLDVPLAPGRHVYSFIVDGDPAPDPAAPRAGDDDFGVPSSVVLVSARGPKT